MAPLKAVDEALAEICRTIAPLTPVKVSLGQALGHVVAEDIIAGTHHPLSDMSAMDGYGVRSCDVEADKPLQVVGESAAGHPYRLPLEENQAVRIYTGAYVPEHCDAIILQEDVTETDGVIMPPAPVEAGRFIRKRGQDFKRDDILVPKGARMTARAMALAALGLQSQAVIQRQPHIAILSSGDELVQAGGIPRFGQLINSNAVFLGAALEQAGAQVTDLGILPDETGALHKAIPDAGAYDLIITTGGASVGKYDYIVSDLEDGAQSRLDFWKIAMRPGKPLIFGAMGETPLIGLPGNPVSVAVCSLVFLRPIIGHMMGRDDLSLIPQEAICTRDLAQNDQRQDYLRAIAENKDGVWHITPFERQDSAMLHKLSQANALLIRPAFDDAIAAGDTVTMALLPDNF